jgi:serine/threonine protein kinase
VHRDLKPENMFLKDGRVILIDFGSSEDLGNPQLRQTVIDDDPRRKTHVNFVGTSQYMSPECVRNQ